MSLFRFITRMRRCPWEKQNRRRSIKKGLYDSIRSVAQSYDDSTWHDKIARKLVDYTNMALDSKVLDGATEDATYSNLERY